MIMTHEVVDDNDDEVEDIVGDDDCDVDHHW